MAGEKTEGQGLTTADALLFARPRALRLEISIGRSRFSLGSRKISACRRRSAVI